MPRKYNLGGDLPPLQLPPTPNLTRGSSGRAQAAIATIADVMKQRRQNQERKKQRDAAIALTELAEDDELYEEREFALYEHDPGLMALTQPVIDPKTGDVLAPAKFADETGAVDVIGMKDYIKQSYIENNFTEADAEIQASRWMSTQKRRVYNPDFGRRAFAIGAAAGYTPSQTATVLEHTVPGGASVGEDDFRGDVRELFLDPLYEVQRKQVGRTEFDERLPDPDQRLALGALMPVVTGEQPFKLSKTDSPFTWNIEGPLGDRFKNPNVWGPNAELPAVSLRMDEDAPLGWQIDAEWEPGGNSDVQKRQQMDLDALEKDAALLVDALAEMVPSEDLRGTEDATRAASALLNMSSKFRERGQPPSDQPVEVPGLRGPSLLPEGELGWGFKAKEGAQEEGAKKGGGIMGLLKEHDTPPR